MGKKIEISEEVHTELTLYKITGNHRTLSEAIEELIEMSKYNAERHTEQTKVEDVTKMFTKMFCNQLTELPEKLKEKEKGEIKEILVDFIKGEIKKVEDDLNAR